MPAALSQLDSAALAGFVVRQRWFGGKARRVADVAIADWLPLVDGGGLAILEVAFDGGDRDRYVLPLAMMSRERALALDGSSGRVMVGGHENGQVLVDGLFDDGLCRALLRTFQGGQSIEGHEGRLVATRLGDAHPGDAHPIARTAPDQSNTSVIFGSAAILKVFRRIEPGINPDVELGTFLTQHGYPHVPRVLACANYQVGTREAASLGILQQFVPNRGNGWESTVAALRDHLERAAGEPQSGPAPDLLALPELLGRRTGAMHVALAAGDAPDLAPEPFDREAMTTAAAAMRRRAESQLQLLASMVHRLPDAVRQGASAVLASTDALLAHIDALSTVRDGGVRLRCHGDFHLGQTLVTDDDVIILDFEGEPARPLAERRAKSSPLRDVAGMLRSFSYAAEAALRDAGAVQDGGSSRRAAAREWEDNAGRVFLRAYLDAVGDMRLLPPEGAELRTVLRAFVLDKACYELGYELNNRPDWLAIPIEGVLREAEPRP